MVDKTKQEITSYNVVSSFENSKPSYFEYMEKFGFKEYLQSKFQWKHFSTISIGQKHHNSWKSFITLVAIEIQNGFLCCLDKQSTRMERGSHNVGIW